MKKSNTHTTCKRGTLARGLHEYCTKLDKQGIFKSVECRITTYACRPVAIRDVEAELAKGTKVVLQAWIELKDNQSQADRDKAAYEIRNRFGLSLWPEMESVKFYRTQELPVVDKAALLTPNYLLK